MTGNCVFLSRSLLITLHSVLPKKIIKIHSYFAASFPWSIYGCDDAVMNITLLPS